MRLVDADTFNEDITVYYCWKKRCFDHPTDWQKGYLYAIDEFQQNLLCRETIEATPIEWLEKQILKAIAKEAYQAAAYMQYIIDIWRIEQNGEKEEDDRPEPLQ